MDVVAFELARALTADLAGMSKRINTRVLPYRNEGFYARRRLNFQVPAAHAFNLFRGTSRARTSGYSGYKRRRVGKRSYRTGRLAGRYRSTQGRLNKELKNFDNLNGLSTGLSSAITLPSSLNTGALLVGLGQGTTATTRTGRKILVKKIQIKAEALLEPGTGTVGTDIFKWWLVLDRQANGAYPSSIADIWSANGTSAEMRNLDTTHRYKILEAGMMEFATGAGVSGAYDQQTKMLDIEHNCNILVEMSSTAGAITEIKSNNILFCCGSINGLVAVLGSTRVRFYDQG